MLVSSELANIPSVERLVDIWAERYLPHLPEINLADDPVLRDKLRHAAAVSGRIETV